MNAGTPIPEPARLSLRLKALRTIPNFRGKSRLARTLLSSKERKRCVLIQDRFGNHMIVPNMVEPVGFSLGVNGSYEPDLVNLLRRHSAKGRDFIDVGANVGAFTVVLAGLSRRVIAIEASPAMLPFLRRNIELNHAANVDVVACAVSDRGIDSVPFYVPPMDHFGMGSSAAQFGVEPVTVAARTMDQVWLDLGAGPVGSVKVDVEGFEAHAFLGATALLDSPHPPLVVFEFCDWAEERAFPGRKGWAQQIMLDAGYKLWSMPEYLRRSASLTKPITEGCHTMVAVRTGSSIKDR